MLNLRNRSFLKEIDFEPQELRFLLAAVRGVEDRQVRRHRGEAPRGQGDRADLREDVDSDTLGVRGRRVRSGRPRDLPRSVGLAARATRSRWPTRHGCSAACTTPSSSAATARPTSRSWPQYAGVPVYNGLTDEWHPTQMLADFLTMHEASGKPYDALAYAFVGDCRFNMGRSLLVMGALMGADVRLAGPASLAPPDDVVDDRSATSPRRTGARITITDDVRRGRRGVDFVHTDVWVSMGEAKDVWDERVQLLAPYQVNAALLGEDWQPEGEVHALPARVPRPEHGRRPGDDGAHRHERGARGDRSRCSSHRPASCSTRPRTGCTRSRPCSSPRSAAERPRRAHPGRPRRQRPAEAGRANDGRRAARQRPGRGAVAGAVGRRPSARARPTATGRRSGCSRCRRRPTRRSSPTRSTCSAPRPRG